MAELELSPGPSPRLPLMKAVDAVVALITTGLCSLLVYHNLGSPPLTGIDDENITQVYGRNLAHGLGYVYTPHFERVEGATSPLWVALHYLLFKVSAQPEPYIIACAAALTALAIFWALGIARCVAGALALPRWSLSIPVLAIAAQPNYFAWTVLSMMDQGVWGAVIVGLAYVLVRQVAAPEVPRRASKLAMALCALSMLTRPESMLLVPAMLAIAAAIVAVNGGTRAAIRFALPYYAAALVTIAALTALRIAYFGYPLPNTYYAKVSSNPMDNIVHGLHYVQSFLHSNVLAVPSVMAIVLALLIGGQSVWASVRARTRLDAAHSVMLVLGGTVAIIIGITVLEGGDHFAGFRMLQPYVPLICVALMFYLPLLAARSPLTASRASGLVWSAGLVGITLAANHSSFALMNKEEGVREEFTLARDGRRTGDLLNELALPAPAVGVLPAGGIAFTYQGRVVDLLGLNWAEMAHASGRRTGLPGHSAFNADVFWKHPPEIMLPRLMTRSHPLDEKQLPSHWELSLLHGLMNEPRFRDDYRPVLMHFGTTELFAYVRVDYLDQHRDDARIVSIGWQGFRPAQSEPPAVSVADSH